MMTILNGDATPLLVGAGVLLIVLVVLFQFVTRPPARSGSSQTDVEDRTAAHSVTVLSRTVLDERRSLVRIRSGHHDHLLLLGEDGDLLIETVPTPLSERNRNSAKNTQKGIPMPFPPQPAARLNQRAIAEYQAVSPIPVPDFLQTRSVQSAHGPIDHGHGAQGHGAQGHPQPVSHHPVMPQADFRHALLDPVPHGQASASPAQMLPPMPQNIPPAMPSIHEHDEVTRKLEEALRQTQASGEHNYSVTPQPVPPPPAISQPVASYPAMPSASAQATGQSQQSEAFEDEIRKLLGRNPHQG